MLDADGRDITDCFAYRQGEVLMGCNALGTPSLISLETMRDCELLSIPLSKILPLMDENPTLLKCYIQFLLKGLERHWEGKMLMYRCSAMERYQWFLKMYPGLIDLVRNKHVASFLGMTPGYHTLNNNYKQPTLSKLKDISSKIFYLQRVQQ